MSVFKSAFSLLTFMDLDSHLGDQKKAFLDELNVQNLYRLKFFSLIVCFIMGTLFILDLPGLKRFQINLEQGDSIIMLSRFFLFTTMGAVFALLNILDIKRIVDYKLHKIIFQSYMFSVLLSITLLSIGDIIEGRGIIAYLATLYVFSIMLYFSSRFSILFYSVNLTVMAVAIMNLNLTPNIAKYHLINAAAFTLIAWFISRYTLYAKMHDFIKKIERKKLIIELTDSLKNVRQLSGLLPICAKCKNIRDDRGYWKAIEIYIKDHSDANFTHGICPDCSKELYGKDYNEKKTSNEDV